MKYYRGKYLIAIYDTKENNEECLYVCDNIKEFADYMHTSIVSAQTILHRLFHKERTHIILDNEYKTVEFIEMNNNDD